eukprot:4818347-Alexandrium_andersonii.AAC.1
MAATVRQSGLGQSGLVASSSDSQITPSKNVGESSSKCSLLSSSKGLLVRGIGGGVTMGVGSGVFVA